MDAFEDYAEEAKQIEKKAVEHESYEGKISIEKIVDLHPEEYVGLTYDDAINIYERVQKIIKASEMFTAKGVERPKLQKDKEAKAKAVEEKIKQMTQETMATAEKMKAAAPVPEKTPAHLEIELERETLAPAGIEFEIEKKERQVAKPAEIDFSKEIEIGEEKPAEKEEIEFEKPASRKIEEEKPVEIEKKEKKIEREEREEKPTPAAPAEIRERRPVAEAAQIIMPSILGSPDKAAQDKYLQIEQEVLSTIGDKADDAAIKKKMLELTKELFKEKSTSRREHIKLEITVLKNMMAGKRAGKTAARGKGKTEEVAHAQLLETIISTQRVELAQTKDTITSNYHKQLMPLRAKFAKTTADAKDNAEKKEAYDALVFALTTIADQVPAVLAKYSDYMQKKHAAEIGNMEKNLTDKEKDLQKKADERDREIESYGKEFAIIGEILKKEIDAVIRSGGREVFKKADAEKTAEDVAEEKVEEKVAEVENMDEGTLLFYLHSQDMEFYKRYERRQISKAEALSHAKALMAKEKGISASTIKKYFGNGG
ncbi:MAG: hypothetical protein V1492_05590 [Candidatus Micrarchaeota archaeon]